MLVDLLVGFQLAFDRLGIDMGSIWAWSEVVWHWFNHDFDNCSDVLEKSVKNMLRHALFKSARYESPSTNGIGLEQMSETVRGGTSWDFWDLPINHTAEAAGINNTCSVSETLGPEAKSQSPEPASEGPSKL